MSSNATPGDLQRARGWGGCRFVDVPPGGRGTRTGRLRFGSGRRHGGEDITGSPKVIEQATECAGIGPISGVIAHRKKREGDRTWNGGLVPLATAARDFRAIRGITIDRQTRARIEA